MNFEVRVRKTQTQPDLGGTFIPPEKRDATGQPESGYEGPRSGIPQARFETLMKQMEDASFSSDKVQVFANAMSEGHKINSAQLAAVLQEITFESDRAKALALAFPQLTDPQNAKGVLLSNFTLDADQVEAILNPRGPVPAEVLKSPEYQKLQKSNRFLQTVRSVTRATGLVGFVGALVALFVSTWPVTAGFAAAWLVSAIANGSLKRSIKDNTKLMHAMEDEAKPAQ